MSTPTVRQQPLPYHDLLTERPASAVELVVVHCTELPDLATAREYGERVQHASGAGNSGHYYVDRDGSIVCYVAGTRIAHHVRGYNERSIGIELVNLGRYPDWWDSRQQRMTEAYPQAQIDSLLALLDYLRTLFPYLRQIAGHADLDTDWLPATDDPARQVRRKLDPGQMFPWPQVLAGCGLAPLLPAPG